MDDPVDLPVATPRPAGYCVAWIASRETAELRCEIWRVGRKYAVALLGLDGDPLELRSAASLDKAAELIDALYQRPRDDGWQLRPAASNRAAECSEPRVGGRDRDRHLESASSRALAQYAGQRWPSSPILCRTTAQLGIARHR